MNGLSNNQKAEVSIIDLNGRKVNNAAIVGNGNHKLNTTALPGGFYILQIQSGDEIMIKRFVKQ